MGGDFGAVYVRLMQGALIAQLSKDILGDAAPAAAPTGGGNPPDAPAAGLPERAADRRPAEGGVSARPQPAEAAVPRPVPSFSAFPAAGAAPVRSASDVVPDQLEPAMRAAADARPADAAPADTVQRMRMTPAASLTLAGLTRPHGTSGDRPDASPVQANAAAVTDQRSAEPPGQPQTRDLARVPALQPASLAGAGGAAGDATARGTGADPGAVAADPRRSGQAVGTHLPGAAAFLADPRGAAELPGAGATSPATSSAGAARAAPVIGAAEDVATPRSLAGAGAGLQQTPPTVGPERAPGILTLAETEALLSAAATSGSGAGVDPMRTSAIAGPLAAGSMPAVAREAFLSAIAALGNRPDQAVSREMLAAVILNAAMIPGWPFPRAYENPAHAADARRASGQLAAAGAEEFKLTPEEMIAYLTSIGANARLLKALQDLFARVEKKEAVKLMAWLLALTSALREIEKSVEDLLRKGTQLPEWAQDVADQIRKGLSRRQRYQI
ncbi:hypothetical protein [Aquibium microcysteis]|uniref:hypothetical protein n=1 Tax=Aquibium microcysteis TaxID=675281 RepID=UPI00165D13D2|nr:hypothetical protein [Aquibium microcysteis]